MKKPLIGLLVGLIVGGGTTWLILRSPAVPPTGAETTAPAASETEKPGAGIHFNQDQLARAGLQIAAPAYETVVPEIAAYGRVLDPAPLVTAAADVATARAALAASEEEAARVQSLHEQGENASAQTVETAHAAAERDRVQLDAARAKLIAAWGPELAQQLDTEKLANEFGRGWTLARIDVPPDETVPAQPKTVKLTLLAGGMKSFEADVLGVAPMADPQLQGRGYLVLLRGVSLPTGAVLRATLPGAGEPQRLAVLPRSAFVRHEGSVFIFVQTGDGAFARHRVELGRELDDGTAVTDGIGGNDRVVIVGAQQLLSAELGAGGEED